MDPLWIDFLNSDWHDPLGHAPRRDRLHEPAWLGEFLAKWKLPALGADAASALGALRSELHGLVARMVAGQRMHPADLEDLNRRLAALPLTARLQVEGDSVQLRLEPGSGGLDAVVLAIVESFAAFLADGDPARLRLCENADCRWVFYDATRSRTRRWCAESCGNLIKVRKFRRRKKAGGSAASDAPAAPRTPPARRPKRR